MAGPCRLVPSCVAAIRETFDRWSGRQRRKLSSPSGCSTHHVAQERNPQLIVALVAGGVWTLTDALWVMAAHDEQAGTINWKLPGTFTAITVNSPTFVSIVGFRATALPHTSTPAMTLRFHRSACCKTAPMARCSADQRQRQQLRI